MKRVLCIWFPLWPIQRRRHAQARQARLRHAPFELSEVPLILYGPARGKLVVMVSSLEAQTQGVKAGMPLAEARALLGTRALASFEPLDVQADLQTLRRLALWCQRFGPVAALEEPDSLFVDITGCGPVFGGEPRLARSVVHELRQLGFTARVAATDTPGSAWALAHGSQFRQNSDQLGIPPTSTKGDDALVIPPGGHRQALLSLPVESLRLDDEALHLLRRLDIRRIDQLQQLPRRLIPARFGPGVLHRLDQAMGDMPETLTAERESEPLKASWPFEYPCTDRRLALRVCERLLEQMLARLRPRQMGIGRLCCTIEAAGSETQAFTIGLLHASNEPHYLMELLCLHLERVRLSTEISAITLQAVLVVPLEFQQELLFAGEGGGERWRRLPELVEVLSNRLGKQAVLRPRLLPDAQPELAWRYEPWLDQDPSLVTKSSEEEEAGAALTRPLILENPPAAIAAQAGVPGGVPLQFQWHGQSFLVARHWGPERIETGWWRGRNVNRDYYLVETTAGERFWLFRVLADGAWFLHGVFA